MWNHFIVERCLTFPASMIANFRALLSRDKRLPLDAWNQSGFQENVFWKFNCLRLIHTAIILKEIQSDDVHRNREAGPEAGRTKIVHTK